MFRIHKQTQSLKRDAHYHNQMYKYNSGLIRYCHDISLAKHRAYNSKYLPQWKSNEMKYKRSHNF